MAVLNGIAVVLFATCTFTILPACSQELPLRGCRRVDLSVDQQHTFENLQSGRMSVDFLQSEISLPLEIGVGPEIPPFERLPLSCENGPKKLLHTAGPNYFHYPTIKKGVCDKLDCDTLSCLVRKKVQRSKCVHTWELVDGNWMYRGPKLVRYVDHLKCSCKQCSDIPTRRECLSMKTCPNNNSPSTRNYCHWRCRSGIPIDLTAGIPTNAEIQTPEDDLAMYNSWEVTEQDEYYSDSNVYMQRSVPVRLPCCDCCEPFPCPPNFVFSNQFCLCTCNRVCPSHMLLNRRTCECECPPGSWHNLYTRECIGSCDRVQNLKHCEKVTCLDSQHFKCRINERKQCDCPSCGDVSEEDYPLCSRTKCTEQPGKPKCVLDIESRRCRCPKCEDENQEEMCLKITCDGIPLNAPCTWDPRNQQCQCRTIG